MTEGDSKRVSQGPILLRIHLRFRSCNHRIRRMIIAYVKFITHHPNLNKIPIANRTPQQLLRQREQHIRPHNPRDRTRAIRIRVPVVREPLARRIVDVQCNSSLFESVCDVAQSEGDDFEDGVAGELVEYHDGVEPVE